MAVTIALAGNPNSGKTTMFNDLTGSSQRVGNWPGVTVEKKDGKLKTDKNVIIQDLPGIYSLSPYTMEEVVTRNYLIKEKPDAIIDIVDASNIERNLYLTTQLTELGMPVVVALNMIDVVQKNGDTIDTKKLGKMLGCEVVETSAIKGTGSREAVQAARTLASKKAGSDPKHTFSADVEKSLEEISDLIRGKIPSDNMRWYSIKVFERDKEVIKELSLDKNTREKAEGIIKACEEKYDDDSESIITNERYNYISQVIQACVTIKNKGSLSTSDKIDRVVTNRWLALPIFAVVMFLVYFISISTVGTWMTDWVNDSLFGEIIPEGFGGWLEGTGIAVWLHSLIMDGIVAGVGAVLGFLPQMLVLFFCLAILEDCGYMSRIAFVLDRVFRKFGLSGKSFIPMLISTGCGVPGIMASRTIESENDRRMTVMTTTFIPCGAKLPIIALIAGALFPASIWVGPSAYFVGIAAVIVSGIMLKKTKPFAGDPAPFVMELPAYHLPKFSGVIRTMFTRGWAFVKKAGTLVLIATVAVWFLSSFSWSMQMVDTEESMLAGIGNVIAPIFSPLGWGDWRAAVATFTGLIAKENVVGTFGVLYGFAEVAEDGAEYWPMLAAAFTQLSAYSFLLFNLLCAPCFAAMGALRREMMSGKWTAFAIAYQCVFAYAVSLMVFQFGTLFTGGGFGVGTVAAILVLALMLYLLFKKPWTPKQQMELGLQGAD
ncbi:ferrous iron transport protein B [Breznakiella homolactica]|uniref:Ferrous iron transport protein B n=1 Tax=Breznakiella homolactica TaxID=2798577 RepID=A0A7T8BB52_9SPIR|nr:ferrous iron transport protein B [Breznakiella homolactica]QQO08868.1 ferrous iron transport protein B [Breznakiella homolactica]